MKHIRSYYKKVTFTFKFGAKTSRDILYQKDSYFLIVKKEGATGIGECSPIPGLSIDDKASFTLKMENLCYALNNNEILQPSDLDKYPSIKFGYETAMNDLKNGGNRIFFQNDFIAGKKNISINGLIWMGDMKFIKKQIIEKLDQDFRCLKIKVSAVNFNSEINILKWIRKELKLDNVEIRLDANGAFTSKDVFQKLKRLADFNIHSIEQPVKSGLYNLMTEVIIKSPIPVALDEELIGINSIEEKEMLISNLKPAYIVLKPTLLGGISSSKEWIELAEKYNIGWWITSALESNIGLNVLAQWAGCFKSNMVQGLGTGNIYSNNIPSPLYIQNNGLTYDLNIKWDLSQIMK